MLNGAMHFNKNPPEKKELSIGWFLLHPVSVCVSNEVNELSLSTSQLFDAEKPLEACRSAN